MKARKADEDWTDDDEKYESEIYSINHLDEMIDDDSLSVEEYGFMVGYLGDS
jgi:hypothetical protein